MKKEVNFISKEALMRSRMSRLRRKLTWTSIWLVSILIGLTVVLTAIVMWEGKQVSSLNKKTSTVVSEIKALANIESMVITISDRSKQVNSIVDKRELIGWSFDLLTRLQNLGVGLNKVEIKAGGNLMIEAKCSSLSMLQQLYDLIEEERRSQRVLSVSYENVGYNGSLVNINLKVRS